MDNLLERRRALAGLLPRLSLKDKSTYVESATKGYDDVKPGPETPNGTGTGNPERDPLNGTGARDRDPNQNPLNGTGAPDRDRDPNPLIGTGARDRDPNQNPLNGTGPPTGIGTLDRDRSSRTGQKPEPPDRDRDQNPLIGTGAPERDWDQHRNPLTGTDTGDPRIGAPERDGERDRDRDQNQDRDQNRDREQNRDQDRDQGQNQNRDQNRDQDQNREVPALPVLKPGTKSSSIIVSPRQRGNPVLKFIRNVPWEFGDIVPDYVLGQSSCALFLSLRYHHLNPDYIHERLRVLGRSFGLQVLLLQVDVRDPHRALKDLAKVCLLTDCTLLLAWSAEEAGRYLETFKSYEQKPPDLLKERVEQDFLSRVTDCLTSVKSVNKTDALSLLGTFGSLAAVAGASREDLSLCPGVGPQKAKRLFDVLHEPFLKTPR
ncbi:PREDICTED: DNA excision repair protein ERCC-1 [Sturnus vulgaris]|uniref:DNA excision repair protein ERCC-1 n=1 Tax=Sturnus vulgaris TaxID=9172 RepID=UPI00071A45A9|nr:PREDICTED: DNA excision repair protein ERCC-1 [Sturnus vulgaris]